MKLKNNNLSMLKINLGETYYKNIFYLLKISYI